MKLWSGILSPFSAKVRIALAEKGLEYETLEVPWSRKTLWGPKPPEFLAVSPHGKVPVLIDGKTAVYDSTVILEYLEDRYPAPPLYPIDPGERARCRQLEDEADQCMNVEVTPLVQELFTKTVEAERDRARVDAATKAILQRYALLDRELAEREHLCDQFTVADIATFMAVGFASNVGVPPADDRTHLHAWFRRVSERPTIAGEFARMLDAAAKV